MWEAQENSQEKPYQNYWFSVVVVLVFYCILQLFFLEDKDHIILYWQANYLEEFPSIDLKILAIGVKNIGLHTMGFRFVFIYRDNQSYASDKFLTRPIGHSSFLHRNYTVI